MHDSFSCPDILASFQSFVGAQLVSVLAAKGQSPALKQPFDQFNQILHLRLSSRKSTSAQQSYNCVDIIFACRVKLTIVSRTPTGLGDLIDIS